MPKKVIPIPGAEVDVTAVLPLLRHPNMARLHFVSQLGGTQPGFPGGLHSRLEHSLGVMELTRRRAQTWARQGRIRAEDVLPLTVACLVHDIGHSALSHVLESDLTRDHHENGRRLLKEMREAFRTTNCSLERVLKLLDKEKGDPLGTAITDRYLGTDKLDYLWRDAHHTGVENPDVFRFVESRLSMTAEHGLVVDSIATAGLKALLLAQQNMYGDFYLRKSSRIAQEFVAKLFGYLVRARDIRRALPLRMTDEEFYSRIWSSRSKEVIMMRKCRRAFDYPKSAIVYRCRDFGDNERLAYKPMVVSELSREKMGRLAKLSRRAQRRIEARIAKELRIPECLTLFVPPAGLHKLVPSRVLVSDNGRIRNFQELEPTFFRALEEGAVTYQAARVCVPAPDRQKACNYEGTITWIVRDEL